MPLDNPLHLLLALGAAAIAGAINAIAGGGTLVAFPAIVGLGVTPLVANATTTVALWPGSVGSMWGYRNELAGARSWALRFALPSLLGGATGALLLLRTSADRFERVVPYLVLAATLLFMAQGPIARRLGRKTGDTAMTNADLPSPPLGYLVYQFFVGCLRRLLRRRDRHPDAGRARRDGADEHPPDERLKNLGALVINAVAAALFAVSGIVRWPIAIAMAVGGLLGGYGGAVLAQRVPQIWVRRAITGVGLMAFVWLLVRR